MPARSSALTERTAETAAAIRGDLCTPSRTMRTLYRLVSMPSIGSRTTVVGVPAGVTSGAMVMPHPMPTRPMAVPTSFTVAPTLGWKPAVMHMLGPRAGGVVRIEEDTTDAELDAFHEIGVRAIRLDLFARASWPTAELIAYIRRMAARATPRGRHLTSPTASATPARS